MVKRAGRQSYIKGIPPSLADDGGLLVGKWAGAEERARALIAVTRVREVTAADMQLICDVLGLDQNDFHNAREILRGRTAPPAAGQAQGLERSRYGKDRM